MKTKIIVRSLCILVLVVMALAPVRASAQLASGITAQRLYVDPRTGQVFIRPGRGRVPLTIQSGPSSAEIQQQVEQQVDQKVGASEARMQASNAQLAADNYQLQQQVTAMQSDWRSYASTFGSRVKIGTLVYGDYAYYTHTGFGPQELTQFTTPGPYNNGWNSFNITRTYLNFLFSPTNDWTLRLTPNMYEAIGGTTGLSQGKNTGQGSTLSGDLGVRIKYAYLRYSKAFQWWDPIKTDTVTFGQQPNPLVDWEEQMYGFRYVNLTPWNYLSLSSSQVGLSVQGPVIFNEKQYVDYDLGVYNNASFHAVELTSTKQGMERISLYPFGANWRFDGLGLTEFFDYGWGNVTPDAGQNVTTTKGGQSAIYRFAALLHYSTEQFNLAFEYDLGKNALTPGQLFSGAGPPQAFGTTPANAQWAAFSTMTTDILSSGEARQQGFDWFGHYHIPDTAFTPFGMFQWMMPNTKITKNPLDFQRYIVGVSYQYNEFLRFAVDARGLMFYHSQFTLPAQAGVPTTPFAVTKDSQSFWLNVEFNY
jgi:hypothetical protein